MGQRDAALTEADQGTRVIAGIVARGPVDAEQVAVLAVEAHRGDGGADLEDPGLAEYRHDDGGHAAGERADHGSDAGLQQRPGRFAGRLGILGGVARDQFDQACVQPALAVELLDREHHGIVAGLPVVGVAIAQAADETELDQLPRTAASQRQTCTTEHQMTTCKLNMTFILHDSYCPDLRQQDPVQ